MRKLKEVAPQVFNFFMDKYNNSANAFFYGLAKGMATFVQSEGGSPGWEMIFLSKIFPKADGESNCGKQHQSIEESSLISAEDLQFPIIP